MIKKLNYYLLTHYPLLWNTRVLWILLANFFLHLFFFLAGVNSIKGTSLSFYNSEYDVGGANLFTFSILCSLVVLILWCIYYLRNNAFKSFYRLPKFYIAKEFLLILLIVFTSTSYTFSFQWGLKTKVRSITSESQLVSEINTVNKALAFIPTNTEAYFILNNCAEKRRRNPAYPQALPNTDTTSKRGFEMAAIRAALQRPDAFSYRHYCLAFITTSSYWQRVDSAEVINTTVNQLLAARNTDAVKKVLNDLFLLLKKYDIEYRLDQTKLANAAFADSGLSVREMIPTQRYNYAAGETVEYPYFINVNQLLTLYTFIENCQLNNANFEKQKQGWNVIGYTTLTLSILLLCYRRFSRKVFLISIVGTLVWAIVISLLTFGSRSERSFPWLLLALCLVFLGWALLLVWQQRNKTAAGVLLNWHIYLAPYFVLLLVAVIQDAHRNIKYSLPGGEYTEEFMQQNYPFSYWVSNHAVDIFLFNLLIVCLYAAFLFNQWAKRWQLMPEE